MDIKMHDTGKKQSESMPITMEKNKIYRPCDYMSTRELPELKGREIGDEFYVVKLVKVKGINIRQAENKDEANYDLEVQSVGLKEKGKKKDGLDFGNYKSPNKL